MNNLKDSDLVRYSYQKFLMWLENLLNRFLKHCSNNSLPCYFCFQRLQNMTLNNSLGKEINSEIFVEIELFFNCSP